MKDNTNVTNDIFQNDNNKNKTKTILLLTIVAVILIAVFLIILVGGKVIINRLERMAPVIIVRVDDCEWSVDLIDSA